MADSGSMSLITYGILSKELLDAWKPFESLSEGSSLKLQDVLSSSNTSIAADQSITDDVWNAALKSILAQSDLSAPHARIPTSLNVSRQWVATEYTNMPRIIPSRTFEPTAKVEIIAEWDGYVEEVHKDYFVARMRGLRPENVRGKEEEAEIPIANVDAYDLDLMAEGGFFRLLIGRETPKVGPMKCFTSVQFRRLPAYSAKDIQAAEKEANEIVNGFRLADDGQAASGA